MVKLDTIFRAKARIDDPDTKVIAIVRRLRDRAPGMDWWPELSPSDALLDTFNGWRYDPGHRNDPAYVPRMFHEVYVPRFLREVKNNPAAHDRLIDIWKMDRAGMKVYLTCFCPNEDICHRSIIAGILAGGLRVDVDAPHIEQYKDYFTMFHALPAAPFHKG